LTENYNEFSNSDINIRDIISILLRRKWVIIGIIMLVVFLTGFGLSYVTPKFTSGAVMQINSRGIKTVDIEAVVAGLSTEEAAVSSEIDIITSRYLIGRVVDKLNLTEDSSFISSKELGFVKYIKEIPIIKDIFQFGKKDNQILPEEEKIRRIRVGVVTKLLSDLKVTSKTKSYTIKIKFISESPIKAALVANTVADEYLVNQLEVKFNETQRVNTWLNERIEELKKKVKFSEKAVQWFKEKHGLMETKGDTITDQQFSELNTQLILAKAKRAETQARLNSIVSDVNSRGIESVTEVLNSPLIQNLRRQEIELSRKASDLSTRYGYKHPKIINIKAEKKEIIKNIDREIGKIIKSLRNEVEIAGARVKTLEENLNSLQKDLKTSGRAEIQLAELEREMNANQTLYQSFLSRFKETTQEQELNQADARIISPAEIPIVPSYPRKFLVLMVGFFAGLAISIAVVALIEHLDNGIRTPEDLEKIYGIQCVGMIPTIKSKRPQDKVVKSQSSLFAETIRSVRTAIHFSNPDNPPKVVMVTSSVPQEGKSLFSMSLARLTANAGCKVMLIDCDLRKPSIAKSLGKKDFKHTLGSILTSENYDFYCEDEETGMHFIPSLANTPNSQELLSSKRMETLIEKLSHKYDLIVLDTPPIMALADSLTLSELADAVIFITRWEETSKDLVQRLQELFFLV